MKRCTWLLACACLATNSLADWQIADLNGEAYTSQYGSQQALMQGDQIAEGMSVWLTGGNLRLSNGYHSILIVGASRLTLDGQQSNAWTLHYGQLLGDISIRLSTEHGSLLLPNDLWRVYGNREQLYLLSYQAPVTWQHRTWANAGQTLTAEAPWQLQNTGGKTRLARIPPRLDEQLSFHLGILGDRLQSDDVMVTEPFSWHP